MKYSDIPDVTANNREIPAGKELICEAGKLPADDPRARPVVIDKRTAWGRTLVELVACPAGWACAGSMMRWDNGWFGVRYEAFGNNYSNRFRSLEEAVERFNKLPE